MGRFWFPPDLSPDGPCYDDNGEIIRFLCERCGEMKPTWTRECFVPVCLNCRMEVENAHPVTGEGL
jgi:hypothetical protein